MLRDLTIKVLVSIFRYALMSIGVWLVSRQIVSQDLFDAWAGEAALALAGGALVVGVLIWRTLNVRFDLLTLLKAAEKPAAVVPEMGVDSAKQQVADEHTAIAKY